MRTNKFKRSKSTSRSTSRATSRGSSVMKTDIMTVNKQQVGTTKTGKIHPKMSLAARVYRLEENVGRVETKYIQSNNNLNLAIASSPATIALLNPLARNTTVQSRIGDEVHFRSMYARFRLVHNANNALYYRVLVVVDNEPNGTTLTTNQFFESTNPIATTFTSFNNKDFMKRFTILYQYEKTLPAASVKYAAGVASDGGHYDVQEVKLNFKNNQVRADYSGGNTGNISDMVSGAIYVIAYQDGDAINTSNLQFNSVLYFHDN